MITRSTGWIASKDRYAVPVMFNPYTREPRDVLNVQSDPQGILIVPPGKAEMLAAPTPAAQFLDDCSHELKGQTVPLLNTFSKPCAGRGSRLQ